MRDELGGDPYSLDDARLLRPVRRDPAGFVRESTGPTFIDEVQRLATLRDRLGSRFTAGVVLHCGDRVQWIADRIVAMPVAALWTVPAE